MNEILHAAFDLLDEKKGILTRVLDVSRVATFTDHFIICTGANQRHVQALADDLEEKLRKAFGLKPSHVEGHSNAQWVLLDYFDFVVHIFSVEAREFYELERLWADAVDVTPVPAAPRRD
ncbi:MAG: ribosome silencing factor [Acidobacteria bacterium]|nr:ribosome silencing factor [Acidobacteriota bacterium]